MRPAHFNLVVGHHIVSISLHDELVVAERRNGPQVDDTVTSELFFYFLLTDVFFIFRLSSCFFKTHLELCLDYGSSDHERHASKANERNLPTVVEADDYSGNQRARRLELDSDAFSGCSVYYLRVCRERAGEGTGRVGPDVEPALVL